MPDPTIRERAEAVIAANKALDAANESSVEITQAEALEIEDARDRAERNNALPLARYVQAVATAIKESAGDIVTADIAVNRGSWYDEATALLRALDRIIAAAEAAGGK